MRFSLLTFRKNTNLSYIDGAGMTYNFLYTNMYNDTVVTINLYTVLEKSENSLSYIPV